MFSLNQPIADSPEWSNSWSAVCSLLRTAVYTQAYTSVTRCNAPYLTESKLEPGLAHTHTHTHILNGTHIVPFHCWYYNLFVAQFSMPSTKMCLFFHLNIFARCVIYDHVCIRVAGAGQTKWNTSPHVVTAPLLLHAAVTYQSHQFKNRICLQFTAWRI